MILCWLKQYNSLRQNAILETTRMNKRIRVFIMYKQNINIKDKDKG